MGTMFPDGGYAIGHPYAETAHWEPFQDEFRDWILATFDGPSDPLAASHIAFYLGLASHGMADQVFDSLYMERSKVYDADMGWSDETASLDTSQDVVFAHLTSPQIPPEHDLPDILPSLFEEFGIDVDMDTLLEGQGWLDVAVEGVAGLSGVPSIVDIHTEAFPWGCSHLLDEDMPGAPPFEARMVAKYWESLWADLHKDSKPLEIMGWWPPMGATGHPRQADDVEARLSVIFNRSLWTDSVTSDHFGVTTPESDHPINPHLFYRDHSHVVNIAPIDDWVEDTEHRLTVDGITATDGREMAAPFTLDFNTGIPESKDTADPVEPEGESPEKSTDKGCAQLNARDPSWVWVLMPLALLTRRRSLLGRPSLRSSQGTGQIGP